MSTTMKVFDVSVPFTGYVVVRVKAPDADRAIDRAFEHPKCNIKNAEEVEFHEHVTEGNVANAVLNDVGVSEVCLCLNVAPAEAEQIDRKGRRWIPRCTKLTGHRGKHKKGKVEW